MLSHKVPFQLVSNSTAMLHPDLFKFYFFEFFNNGFNKFNHDLSYQIEWI